MTAEARLRQALRRGFELLRDEAEGKRPAAPMIRGRLADIERAAAACPDAVAVYRAAAEAWRQQTGRCPLEGVPVAACRCGPEMIWRGATPASPGEVITVISCNPTGPTSA